MIDRWKDRQTEILSRPPPGQGPCSGQLWSWVGGWRTIDSTSDAPSSMKTRKLVGDRFKRFSMEYIQK